MSENEEISKLTQLKEKLFPSIGKEIPTGVSKQIHKNLAMSRINLQDSCYN
jgi:hypothetical protein